MSFKVSYDQDHDILYLAREGEEAESLEVGPGITLELRDGDGSPLAAVFLGEWAGRANAILNDEL